MPVLYPPGSTGVPLPASAVRTELESLPLWAACLGEADVLWASEGDQPPTPLRAPFDDYVAHLPDAFGWLVIAEPLPVISVDAERNRLMSRIPMLRQRENSEVHRIELERTQARYRELTKARTSGVWSVRVLVGGPDIRPVGRTAALLCSASDLEDVPYVLTPGARRGHAGAMPGDRGRRGRRPVTVSRQLRVPGVGGAPARRELPGIRTVSPRVFDVTPESGSGPDHVVLGSILDESLIGVDELRVRYDTLNRHAFVCGATGSGKSQTSRNLLETLARAPRPVPWLVVEPAKAEYARMAARLGPGGRVLTIRPGDLGSPPASLNPLEPEAGFPLQSHADLVRALFLAAFEANEPFPQVLSEALLRCYTSAGWDLVTGEPRPATKPRFRNDEAAELVRPRYPTLGELQAAARDVVDNIGYGKEVAADVRGFVDVRIGSLRGGTPGRFFEGGHPLDIGGLLRRNVVLELEPITNDQDKAFLMGAVLIRIVEHLRVRDQAGTTPGLQARPADRGSAPAAEKRDRRPGRGRGGAVRVPAGRDPGLRRRCRGGRADPRQDRARRDQEHGAEGDAPAAGQGRPGRRRGHHEPGRGPVRGGGRPAARCRRRHHRRGRPAPADPGPAGRGPGGRGHPRAGASA